MDQPRVDNRVMQGGTLVPRLLRLEQELVE
jgi:hypothetical protein